MNIDTGGAQANPFSDAIKQAREDAIKDGLGVNYEGNGVAAEREHRKIITEINCCDTRDELNSLLDEQSVVIDALFLSYPDLADRITAAAAEWGGMLAESPVTSVAPDTAQQRNRERKKMFNIPTNTGGDSGPFLSYKQRAGQGMPDGSWYLREKDGDDWSYSDMTDAFKSGFVADIFATHDGQLGGTLKMGFIKFSEGVAPERHWFKSPLAAEQRPSEEKTATGGFAWQSAISFMVATGGGRAVQCDVTGWGGYKGMMGLLDILNSGFADNIGKCPVVQYTGWRQEGTGQKRLHVPEFAVPQWVARPECLTPEAPAIPIAAPEQPAAQIQSVPPQAVQPQAATPGGDW